MESVPRALSGKYCIIGVGHTRYGSLPGMSTLAMHVEAIRNAIADARISKDEIDAVLCKAPTSAFDMGYSLMVAQRIGVVPRVTAVLDQEGATGISLIGYAMMCIEAGQCSVAVISYADNPRTGSRHRYARGHDDNAAFGWFGTPSGYALIAQRHMYEYGTTSEQLGAISVACHRHGALNPNAQRQRAITLADHQASRMIVDPLRLYDCALVSDGGAAFIVTSVEHARRMGIEHPVRILGIGQAHPAWDVPYRDTLTTSGAKRSGEHAFAMAGVEPKDIDVAQIYDCFTITVLITLEDYGFCAKGEGGAFVQGGRIELGGELPINTSGGLLSETGMPGFQLIVEAVRQLRGECGPRQVADAELALVSNQGGIMHTHSTLILGK
jgi:acetyl-CoA acetyltransferase